MNLTIIAAISKNDVIGNNGKLPWGMISKDMERFRKITGSNPVIMGRKTYESLPDRFRPLPGRKNIILSRSLQEEGDFYVARKFDEVIRLTEGLDSCVIGGSEIYRLFLPDANKMELTRLHRYYEGDTFFPDINFDKWRLTNEYKGRTSAGLEYSFLTYDRK